MDEPNVTAFEVGHMAKCELNMGTDTIYCGINFRPLAFMGQLCEVRGFHYSMDTTILVACCATTFTHPESGARFALVVNETLYFGKTTDHSLINPNQIGSLGYKSLTTHLIWINHLASVMRIYLSSSELKGQQFTSTLVPCWMRSLSHVPWSSSQTVILSGIHKVRLCLWFIWRDTLLLHLCWPACWAGEKQMWCFAVYCLFLSLVSQKYEQLSWWMFMMLTQLAPQWARHGILWSLLISYHDFLWLAWIRLIRSYRSQLNRVLVHPITWRYWVDHLDLHRNRLQEQWHGDWLSSGVWLLG